MTLIIAILMNGILTPLHAYPIEDSNCEEIRQHKAVIESWKGVYGENVVLICKQTR
jgi:hypothetical protein